MNPVIQMVNVDVLKAVDCDNYSTIVFGMYQFHALIVQFQAYHGLLGSFGPESGDQIALVGRKCGKWCLPSRHKTLIQCWLDAGPTLNQH